MSVDPDLRVALGFILLLRFGIGFLYPKMSSEIGVFAEHRKLPGTNWKQWIVLACLTFPLILFVYDAEGMAWALWEFNSTLADYSVIHLPEFLRCLMLVPAVVGLVLAIWTRHCAVSPAVLSSNDSPGQRFITGPFHYVRCPHVSADLLLFGPLLVATGNWIAIGLFFVALVLLRGSLLRKCDEAWRNLLGDAYGEYADRTGLLLPKMPKREYDAEPHYAVPKRFGLSAIIALVTMFAVIFGGINVLQAEITEVQLSPMLHLFFGVELLTIWICQMRFGHSPRGVSTLVGAVLLPLFMLLNLAAPPAGYRSMYVLMLIVIGGLVGYCLGTLAAGLFLVMDWVGPYLPWSRQVRFSEGPTATAASPWSEPVQSAPGDKPPSEFSARQDARD